MKRLSQKNQDNSTIQDIKEEEENLLLRRIDWRFLLPKPNPERSICFSTGIIAEALKLKLKTKINPGLNHTPNEYDLAVAVNPNTKTLNAAFSALKPGGICYVECDANAFFKPSKTRKLLRAIGFDDICFYMPKPEPENSLTNIWIPIECIGAVEYLIQQSHKESSEHIALRLVKKLRNTLWTNIPSMLLSNPFLLSSDLKKFTVSIISHKPISKYQIRTVVQQGNKAAPTFIFDNLNTECTGRDSRFSKSKFSVLMLTKGKAVHNKIILIAFHNHERDPIAVIKIARSTISVNPLLNEVRILKKLEEESKVMKGVPKIIMCKNDTDLFVQGQTFLNGIPLSNILNKKNYSDFAFKVTSWLTVFAKRSKKELTNKWKNAQVESVVSAFSKNYSALINAKQISMTQDIISNLTVPFLVCEHRDVAPWNIIINDKLEVGLADWESSELYGLPGRDLIYFLINISLYIHSSWKPDDMRACYRKMLDSSTLVGIVFHDCITYYFSELGLPESSIKPLRLMTSLIHSLERFHRRYGGLSENVDSDSLRNSLYFICWEEEISGL